MMNHRHSSINCLIVMEIAQGRTHFLKNILQRIFSLDQFHTTVRIEAVAGLTTFLTMAYILLVNPAILANAGIDPKAAFVATALSAVFGSLCCGLLSNLPVAIAPGMGLNAYFAFVVVKSMGFSWQDALGAVFIAGVIFIILTFFRIRQWIINAIPMSLHVAIAAGIGLFLGVIALKELGVIVSDPVTLVKLGVITNPQILLGFLGFCLIVILEKKGVRGAIILSIIAISLLSFLFGFSQYKGVVSWPASLAPTFMQLDIFGAIQHKGYLIIFTFFLVALFDSTGTILGLIQQVKMAGGDEYGMQRSKITQALFAEGLATTAGGLLGTSTTTAYIESAAGIQAGGRTGLTACVVAGLFLLTLFFAPLAESVPVCAYTPALLYVACKMFNNVVYINWEDATEYVPSTLMIIMIPLSFSIGNGIAIGFVAYLVLVLLTGQWKKIKLGLVVLALVSAFFLALANSY